MRKIIFILITIIIFPFLILAHSDSDISSEDILRDIMESQNVSGKSQISCDKVTDEQFEELGETVMGIMHPDEGEHELMDQMMGGEGSESLKAMHILMGKRYLGCASGTGGMMNGGMMGMMPMTGMMGENNYFWLNTVTYLLIWIFLIVAIIFLVFWILKQRKN